MKNKQAELPGGEESLVNTDNAAKKVQEHMEGDENMDIDTAIDTALPGVTLQEDERTEIKNKAVTKKDDGVEPIQASIQTSGTRALLYNLNKRYASNDLDFVKAIKVWKSARLSPNMIREQVLNDIKKSITSADSMILHRLGGDLQGYEDLDKEYVTDALQKLKDSSKIKLTASIRSSVDRIGQNLYRTKNASVLWKIDMRDTDDGQQVPYLVRLENIEAAEDTDEGKES